MLEYKEEEVESRLIQHRAIYLRLGAIPSKFMRTFACTETTLSRCLPLRAMKGVRHAYVERTCDEREDKSSKWSIAARDSSEPMVAFYHRSDSATVTEECRRKAHRVRIRDGTCRLAMHTSLRIGTLASEES